MIFPELNPYSIKSKLAQSRLGGEVFYFETVDSTNNCARNALHEGADHGSLFLADSQRMGRGRFGRSWQSTPGAGIYLSVILRPNLDREDCPKVSLIAGLAAVLAVNRIAGVHANLKWPNDVLLGGKKICGILSEFHSPTPDNCGIIVGVGVNVHHDRDCFKGDLENTATSLEIESGRSLNRNDLIVAFLEDLDSHLSLLENGDFKRAVDLWMENCEMFGKEINISQGGSTFRGKALGLDEQGNLLLELDGGKLMSFDSGEATLK